MHTYFNYASFTSAEFSDWISRVLTDSQVHFKLCETNFALSNMGVKTLKSHSECQKHQKLLEERNKITSFFKKKDKASTKVVEV